MSDLVGLLVPVFTGGLGYYAAARRTDYEEIYGESALLHTRLNAELDLIERFPEGSETRKALEDHFAGAMKKYIDDPPFWLDLADVSVLREERRARRVLLPLLGVLLGLLVSLPLIDGGARPGIVRLAIGVFIALVIAICLSYPRLRDFNELKDRMQRLD